MFIFPAFGVWLSSYLIEPIFKKYMPEKQVVEQEDDEYRGDDNTVEKIGDNKYSLEYVKSLEFSVNYYRQQKCKNKLGDSRKEIPGTVFEH